MIFGLSISALQKSLKEGRRNVARPVQRPGTASLPGERAPETVALLNKQLSASGKLRDAAKFLAASRRART